MIGEEETLKKRLESSVEKTSEEVERLCKDLIIVDENMNKTGIDPEFSFQPILMIWEESYHVKGNAFIDVGLLRCWLPLWRCWAETASFSIWGVCPREHTSNVVWKRL